MSYDLFIYSAQCDRPTCDVVFFDEEANTMELATEHLFVVIKNAQLEELEVGCRRLLWWVK